MPDGEPKLVHYEETEYRMKPAWTPDGQAFLFVSDEMGSNDVSIIPVAGGNPIVLTADACDAQARQKTLVPACDFAILRPIGSSASYP